MQLFKSAQYYLHLNNNAIFDLCCANFHSDSRLCTRGDLDFNTHLPCKRYFNSRLYIRGDVSHSIVLPVVEDILIHASTWEATHVLLSAASHFAYFNSRLYMRGNQCRWIKFLCSDIFQFTPLHERQRSSSQKVLWGVQFQFTPLHERQLGSGSLLLVLGTFQFTPLHERQHVLIIS